MDADTIRRRRYGLIPSMISAMLRQAGHSAIKAVAEKRLADTYGLLSTTTLRPIAIACRAESGPRRDRLALDLTAIIRAYETLETETDDPATVASTDAKVRAALEAIKASRDMMTIRSRAAQCMVGLSGVASMRQFLALVVEEVLTREIGPMDDLPRGLGGVAGRVTREVIIEQIDAIVTRHLILAASGLKGNLSPLADVIHECQRGIARICGALDAGDVTGRPMAVLMAALYDTLSMIWEDQEAHDPLYDASVRLEAELAVTRGLRKERMIPSSEEALIWAVCLLIEGWQPVALDGGNRPTTELLTISKTKSGAAQSWAADLLTAYGLDEAAAEDFETTSRAVIDVFREGKHANPFRRRASYTGPTDEGSTYDNWVAAAEIDAHEFAFEGNEGED